MLKFNEFWDSSGATRNAIMGGLVAAAVLAAPLMGAAVAGAISLAVGLAGIGGGVALALRDPRIKASASEFGKFLMSGLNKAGGTFLRPVQSAMEILRMGFDRFFPRLERGFQAIAPYVTTLAVGFNDFLDAIGPGLEAAFGNSGPFLTIFAEYLPVIGDALGYMFEELSNSEGARAGLIVFFQMAADAIIIVTDALTFLADLFVGFLRFIDHLPDYMVPDGIQQDVDEMIAGMEKIPNVSAGASAGILNLGGAAGTAAGKARDLTASLNDFFGAQLGWVDANIAFEGAIDDVAAAFKGANDNIDIGTAKGRENVGMVNTAIKAAIASRDAEIKKTGSVAAGNAVYLTHIERLRGVLHAAGLTDGQIQTLIGSFDELPPGVSTELSVPGLALALSQAQKLNYELGQIQHDRLARRRSEGTGNNGGLAEGGVVRQEQLTWIGEGNKPEAVIPLTNPGRAAEVMAEAGLLGMGGGTTVVQLILDGKVIDERIVRSNQGTARSIAHQPKALI